MAVNSKLKKWKFSNPEVCAGKRAVRGPADALIIIGAAKERAGRVPVQFKLSGSLCEQSVFKPGDLLDMSYDDGIVVVFRGLRGGRKLHKPSRSGRSIIEFSMPPAYAELFAGKRAGSVEAENGRVAFVLLD